MFKNLNVLFPRFDFCQASEGKRPSENLGQVLFGERIEPSPYKVCIQGYMLFSCIFFPYGKS